MNRVGVTKPHIRIAMQPPAYKRFVVWVLVRPSASGELYIRNAGHGDTLGGALRSLLYEWVWK